jgi:hypothetical protein
VPAFSSMSTVNALARQSRAASFMAACVVNERRKEPEITAPA